MRALPIMSLPTVADTRLWTVKLSLNVHYTDEYPDVLPELAMECVEGELDDAELTSLEEDLKAVVSIS